ncbi:hypothetical protein LO772_09330 [Yinghuangia sp. ASG 101]|nr:hypothetical protein [Yinghuangia sp. ASG 101]UGQ15716.1 hypothetical protein LO772_09330 [Yinghuangia sp. ASG 101]
MTDPYVDPETGVFRNKLGITDALLLTQAEADLSHAALVILGRRSLPGS